MHRPPPEDWLEDLLRASPWMLRVLAAAREADLPQWWIGGGVLRDLVWDTAAGGFDPDRVRDVDLAFFDPDDLSPERDRQADALLRRIDPGIPWEATNQAAVHTWYPAQFGIDVAPLHSAADGVRTWPETATAVAVRWEQDGSMRFIAVAGGIADLLGGVCRRNPRRVTVAEYRRRLARKQVHRRWPRVQVMPE